MISYADACLDPNLFGPWFSADSWAAWRVIDKALFGQPLAADELPLFRELTGRDEPPSEPASELWCIFGRRSGKDVKAASLVAYLATIGAEALGFRRRLTRGERGVVQLLAVDRDQAAICFNYVREFFEQPLLARMVSRVTADSIELNNKFAIEVFTNDQRRVRGRTVCAAVLDEVAHWRDEHASNPDEAVYNAIKPSMATMMPGALLIGISSAHARRGLLWRKFSEAYGRPGNILVAKAPTWVMNPTIPRDGEVISDAFKGDPQWAAAEYGSEFRTDVQALVTREAVEACIASGIRERPPNRQHRYFGFVDPSGGSADSMTLAIAHAEGDRQQKTAILDLVREVRPPFSPEQVCEEFAEVLRRYRITKVVGDNYAGEWPKEQFRKRAINYERSERAKSGLYLDLLPLINSRAVDLLDDDVLRRQLLGLERTVTKGGADKIDHAKYERDDLVNSAAGCLTLAAAARASTTSFGRSGRELPPVNIGYEKFKRGAIGYRPFFQGQRGSYGNPAGYNRDPGRRIVFRPDGSSYHEEAV
jgi:hypothetical protein